MAADIRIGCAGWAIQKAHMGLFPGNGSHLERYAAIFNAVEINSSFRTPHRRETYARWAGSVPSSFRFSVKVPKQITHVSRLSDITALENLLSAAAGLGEKLGPLLVQLPPSLEFDHTTAEAFFAILSRASMPSVVCEPRHPSWFSPDAEVILDRYRIARVAADPAPGPSGSYPGGWLGIRYFRLHGAPRRYYSSYPIEYLRELAERIIESAGSAPVWCIFDNTASGAAIANAISLIKMLAETL